MRLHLLLLATKYPYNTVLVGEKIVADGLVQQILFVFFQLLYLFDGDKILFLDNLVCQIIIFLDVMQMVYNIFRINEVGKYYSVF